MVEPILAAQDTWFTQGGTSVKRASITEIEIVGGPYTPAGTVTSSWDASAAKDGSVMAYVEGTKLTISGNGYGRVYANPDSTATFSSTGSDYFSALTTFTNGNLLDTSKVTNMNDMFRRATSLKTVDVSNWDVSNVTSMYRTFAGNSSAPMSLQTLDVSRWNTGKVTTMRAMFQYCNQLTTLNVGNWETGEVTTMRNLFGGCSSLEALYLNNWETGKVSSMEQMFYGCSNLTELDLSNWDVSNVTTMNHMFTDCTKMTSYNFSGWNTVNVTTIAAMFNDNSSLVSIDVSDFDCGSVVDFGQVFERCSSLESISGLEKWDTKNAISFYQTFLGCSSLAELNLSSWDTSKAEICYYMFADCGNLETIYVSDKWSTEGLKDVFTFSAGGTYNKGNIFPGCTKLVGGAGTAWADNHIDYSTSIDDTAYAKVDGGTENPGYLTNIDDSTQLLIQTGTMHKLGLSVRGIIGDTVKRTPSEMVNALKDTCADINEQSSIIAQLQSALDGKSAAGSSGANIETCNITLDTNNSMITGCYPYHISYTRYNNGIIEPVVIKDNTERRVLENVICGCSINLEYEGNDFFEEKSDTITIVEQTFVNETSLNAYIRVVFSASGDGEFSRQYIDIG
jgi:surface protein